MTTLRDQLERLRTRGPCGPAGFLAWWRDGLVAWLPASWRRALGMSRDRLWLTRDGDAVRVTASLDGATPLPLVAADGHPLGAHGVLLRWPVDTAALDAALGPRRAAWPRWTLLPAAAALRRSLPLPAAAADRLRDVVGFEIDRQTPFAADAVYYDARVAGTRLDGTLDVALVVVPRPQLDAAVDALGPLVDSLAGVDVAGMDGRPGGMNLLPPARRRRTQDPMRAWNALIGAGAFVALVLAAWLVLDNRRAAADAFDAQVQAAARRAHAVALDREALVNLVDGAAFLAQARAARPTTLEVLDELSRRLPDGTYLEKLAIEDDRLTLIGLSTNASSLVDTLGDSPLWKSASLTGALQPDPGVRRDRFTLTAELVGSGAPPAGAAPAASHAPQDSDATGGTL